MTRIVLLHEGELPTLEETYKAFQYLVKTQNVSVVKVNSFKFTDEQMKETDVIICVRGHSPITYYILWEAKRLGKRNYFLLDDDLKDMPKGSFWFPERKKWLLKCIHLCHGLITSNQLIGDEYRKYLLADHVIILNTAVDPTTIQEPETENGRIKIVMTASEWHTANFVKYVKNACIELANEYRDRIEFYFVGLHPNMKEMATMSKAHYVPPMKMDEYVSYMSHNRFDIGIAVLVPDHFNERKYFNKFIEYTRYGICGVYSDCMPYRLVVKDGWNGIFTENTSASWHANIKRVIDNAALRRNCIENAQEYLATEHAEKYIFEKLVTDCPDLISYYSGTDISINELLHKYWKARHIVFRICESVYLTVSSLTHFGIKTTINKMKRKITMLGGRR